MYKKYFKRFFDVVISLFLLVIFIPVMLLVLILLFVATRENPFFVQTRPGLNEKIFRIIKLKTMNDNKSENGELLPDAQRLTTIGRFIRKTSLDEIPQLINVLMGDMAIIGPRPLLVSYLPYYSERERLRHSIRPGITGWAQINGRNSVNWDERLAFDVEYVKSVNFKFDIKILYKTLLKIIVSEGVVVDPESIMKNLDDERGV
ncbi:MAG: undecaprenyl phosphate N,N'-diacetylbacillosamine 1-phosphate transferase [Patiriisocius sp.]|jgi:undecaprenyl phosphate N,N'-diacetylbacillosamine 1-phosphate transferase